MTFFNQRRTIYTVVKKAYVSCEIPSSEMICALFGVPQGKQSEKVAGSLFNINILKKGGVNRR